MALDHCVQAENPRINNRPRRHRRVLFSAPIEFHYLVPGGVRSARGISLDLGEGGVGALVQGALQPGAAVGVDLELRGGLLSAVAIVRHASSCRSGLEFLGLTPQERLCITDAIRGVSEC